VNQAITQMDEVTQQNAALVEQATAAAESMREQAGNLAQAVSVFRLEQTVRADGAPSTQPKAEVQQLAPRAKAKAQVAAKLAPGGGALARAKTGTDDAWEEF